MTISPESLRLGLPRRLLDAAIADIRQWGTEGAESMVFFLGMREEGLSLARAVVLAEGPGIVRAPRFLRLSEKWMLRLTECCEDRGEFVVAHLHSHGMGAFHSDTDEHHIFHAPGCFSVVVPDFGNGAGVDEPSSWAVYVGTPKGAFEPALDRIDVVAGGGDFLVLSEAGARDA